MRSAESAPALKLFNAAVDVINGLLNKRPEGLKQPGYRGNTRDTITGYLGVRIFLFTDEASGRHSQPVIKLQVDGPSRLLDQLVTNYRDRYTSERTSSKRVVFHIND